MSRRLEAVEHVQVHSPGLQDRLARINEGRPAEQAAVIERALETAERAHRDQRRASGEPFVHHALAVAEILAGLRMDHETLAAAILHDVVEDTDVTLADVEAQFGAGVARLVDGVTKMEIIHEYRDIAGAGRRERAQAESLRKMLLAMAEDVRVVLIKLADRLHNMRTLEHLPTDKQRRIARETMEIYAPLANRLGIWQIKWELEDLAFRYLEPEAYWQVVRWLDERREDRERYIAEVIDILQAEFAKAGIRAEIRGRPKHLYSIWSKMRHKGVGLDQLFDVRAVRVLVNTVAECYHALGIVHSLWQYLPGEFDDYIATPKENNYRSLHTAVIGPEGKTLEVQIRTYGMHRHAEYGVAAHWFYKEGGKRDLGYERKIDWMRQLLEWKDESADADDFIERFKSEVFQDRIYVFTPRGDVVDLPRGATPLDFAYHIHTDVGHRTRGAKVDGHIVPLTYELQTGQQVEILTAKQGAPSRDWLSPYLGYLKTSRARSKVRHWFNQQNLEKNVAAGREAVDREMHRLGVSGVDLEEIAGRLGYDKPEELFAAVGRGDVTTAQVAANLQELARPSPEPEPPVRAPRRGETAGDVKIEGVGDLLTRMARCCKPVPNDPIVGYITRGRGVTVHRQDCPNMLRLDGAQHQRLIEVQWAGAPTHTYPVDVLVEAVDRQGLLRDVTAVLANEKINVTSMSTRTEHGSITARIDLTLEVTDMGQLSRVLSRMNQLPNVVEARRIG
ncbi:MAG: GTP diphosphokinase [Gammaproteobacteria bacterium]|nr:GTP diphosphokinase [Gammaproteobacteria bacterium]